MAESASTDPPRDMPDLAIDRGQLIDGTEAEPIDDARVLIADGVIDAYGTHESVHLPEDAEHVSYPEARSSLV